MRPVAIAKCPPCASSSSPCAPLITSASTGRPRQSAQCGSRCHSVLAANGLSAPPRGASRSSARSDRAAIGGDRAARAPAAASGPSAKSSGHHVRATNAVAVARPPQRQGTRREERGRGRVELRAVHRDLRGASRSGSRAPATSANVRVRRASRVPQHVGRADPHERRQGDRRDGAAPPRCARRRTRRTPGAQLRAGRAGTGTAITSSRKYHAAWRAGSAPSAGRATGRPTRNACAGWSPKHADRWARHVAAVPVMRDAHAAGLTHGDLARGDLVAESVRVEAVDALAARLGLRVHEERHLRSARARRARRRARSCSPSSCLPSRRRAPRTRARRPRSWGP